MQYLGCSVLYSFCDTVYVQCMKFSMWYRVCDRMKYKGYNRKEDTRYMIKVHVFAYDSVHDAECRNVFYTECDTVFLVQHHKSHNIVCVRWSVCYISEMSVV